MEARPGDNFNRNGFPLTSPSEGRDGLLEKVKAARQGRAQERHKQECATKIQALIRGWLFRRMFQKKVRSDLVDVLKTFEVPDNFLAGSDADFPPPAKVYEKIPAFLFFANVDQDRATIYSLCRYMVWSMSSTSMTKSFVAVMLNKDVAVDWIRNTKKLLTLVMNCLPSLDPGLTAESRCLTIFLHTLVTFTSTSSWTFMKDSHSIGSLSAGLKRLCENFLGHLIQEGMYPKLRAVLIKGTCSPSGSPSLKHASLLALISLALRPLKPGGFSKNIFRPFVTQILAVPAIVYNIENLAREVLEALEANEILARTIKLLADDDACGSIISTLDGNFTLSLLGNLINLVHLDLEKAQASAPDVSRADEFSEAGLSVTEPSPFIPTLVSIPDQMELVVVLIKLIDSCRDKVDENCGLKKKGKLASTSVWHPILGWYSQPIDRQIHDALPCVWKQLNYLWSLPVIRFIFRDLFTLDKEHAKYFRDSLQATPLGASTGDTYVRDASTSTEKSGFVSVPSFSGTNAWSTFKKMVEKGPLSKSSSGGSDGHPKMKLGESKVTSVAISTQLYTLALKTLKENRVAILSGLCVRGELLVRIWRLLRCLGKKESCGLNQWLEAIAGDPEGVLPHFDLLTLFCEASAYLLTILDDKELYEDQKPFHLEDLVSMSSFLNNFVFYGLYNGYVDPNKANSCGPFVAVHSLLMVLYQRDSRRPFCPANHWLMKDASSSSFMYDVEKKRYAQVILRKIPHVVPHEKRVILFRDCVTQDKLDLGLVDSANSMPPCTLITVRRTYIVEDGYRQLIGLTPLQLKSAVRVKFVNAQGLDEAGIDQDGVFKEFLEETVKRVFDPAMNLFKTTSEGRIYPSPTSYINENYYQLFEFVGRMLAKAVYEGIVIDVPFAQFFLSQIVGSQTPSTAYSCVDELPSLDPELYKNLTYVKHYDGDISDLELTFTCDEDVLGQVMTHELVPGGRIIQVTNDNKILYIHKMAHFRMRTQIQHQVTAFRKGFRSIINPDWLALFSTPEVQRLISGDTNTIDLKDLRKNTQYYGGFHDKHRIVSWLWDILDKDFSEQERRLFLKFVTSCSSPPLLGFGNLEPPFSIRCVEVGEDEDTGDTIGSVLRGFFTIRKKDPVGRLPTSSTCFNLLKLPNYQKRSTLKEKLRYAIHSNTGFELS